VSGRRRIRDEGLDHPVHDGSSHLRSAHARKSALVLVASIAIAAIVWGAGGVVVRTSAAAGGNAKRGERLFATLPCASCHDIAHRWPGGEICPNLGNIATEAARIVRLPDYHGRATDAAGYIRESIVDPNAYIVPGSNYRAADGQSVMPKTFRETLKPSELDDIVAFLMTRR
jgi:mono/diheme cytochrome c family protein